MYSRRLLVFVHDLVAAAAAWMLGYWLRFNLEIPPDYASAMVHRLPVVVGICAVTFWALGLYRGLWRYASLHDIRRILIAVGIVALAMPAVMTLSGLGEGIPRSVYLIAPPFLALVMGGSRLAYRGWR
ncbi:MAG TPA: polysaccharide biosynthesis protein, partial [Burkholderiales bacterium]|nr:polysaccharide biosynthesis protein [Burkholderiales bacterium]